MLNIIICTYFTDVGISKPQWVRKHKVQKIQSNSKMSDKSFPSRINLIKKRTISDPFAGMYVNNKHACMHINLE